MHNFTKDRGPRTKDAGHPWLKKGPRPGSPGKGHPASEPIAGDAPVHDDVLF